MQLHTEHDFNIILYFQFALLFICAVSCGLRNPANVLVCGINGMPKNKTRHHEMPRLQASYEKEQKKNQRQCGLIPLGP